MTADRADAPLTRRHDPPTWREDPLTRRYDLPTHWVWDFWLAQEPGPPVRHHLFHLAAPKTLPPQQRHTHARVWHAVSTDLVTWTPVGEALGPSPRPAFDDLAIWTGSVVRADDGTWAMFYSAIGRAEGPPVQRIGMATSPDLDTWTRVAHEPLVVADPRWYVPGTWRDPWVLRDPLGDGWHMLITAEAAGYDGADAAVIGHARSPDLWRWEVRPPLSAPGAGFGELEVPQLVDLGGSTVLVVSCPSDRLSPDRRARFGGGGIWSVPSRGPVGPFDSAAAVRLTDESLYVGKIVRQSGPTWAIMAFVNQDLEGRFVGGITLPLPVVLPLGQGPLLTSGPRAHDKGARR